MSAEEAERITRRTVLHRLLGATAAVPILGLARLCFASSPPDVNQAEQSAITRIAQLFMHDFDVPALSIAIARDGMIPYADAFGFAAPENKLTTSNLFRIASVSKPITSAAIYTLVEAGRLHPENKVFGPNSILGFEYGRKPYGKWIDRITVDHLLTHTCGGWDNGRNDPMFSSPKMNHAELISSTLDNQPLTREPGSAYAYSNFGYCLLGRVIEAVTRKSYSEYVENAVLSRCGISDMQIGKSTLRDRVQGEVLYHGQSGETPYEMNVERMDSHGGWIATACDLVHFGSHVDGLDPSRNILRPETIKRMSSPSAVNPSYARGWSVNAKGNCWHVGSLPGTTSILVRTSSGYCWGALASTRRQPEQEMGRAIDQMMWDIMAAVRSWKSVFSA